MDRGILWRFAQQYGDPMQIAAFRRGRRPDVITVNLLPLCLCGQEMVSDGRKEYICPRRRWYNFWKHDRTRNGGWHTLRPMKIRRRVCRKGG